ncbi:structure-specific recognition protein 1 [Pancytospora epiphaga]|nr:structure-specific recognition protein 1 [Pancytospora epiphaga]
MEILAIDQLRLNNKLVEMRMLQDGIELSIDQTRLSMPKEDIKLLEIFRGTNGFCLRISTEGRTYDLRNLHESQINGIRAIASQRYGLSVAIAELEILNTIHGNLFYTNNMVSFQGSKCIFAVPREDIKNVTELENDLEFQLEDAEIVFSTSSNIAQLLNDKVSEEVCIVNDVSCLNPRSKSTLVFYGDYLVLRGSSYNHTIFYSDVEEMYYLKRDTQYYLVVRLAQGIVQGQTRYDSLVFLVGDKMVEVAAKDHRLKSFYTGDQAEILVEIMESLIKIKAQESIVSFKCVSKTQDGHLYLLSSTIQFLPKSISIPLSEVSYVEFSRINLSIVQAKTFDMTIFGAKPHYFKGIQKDSFGKLELYFNENGIKMVSEVVEESESCSDYDSTGSNLSSIIEDDE